MRKILSLVICVLLCTPVFANAAFNDTFSSQSHSESLWDINAWDGAEGHWNSGVSFTGSNPRSGIQFTSKQAMTGDFIAELVFDNFTTTQSGAWQETPNIGFSFIDEDGKETSVFFTETIDDQGMKTDRGFVVVGRFETWPNGSGSMIIQRAGNTVYLRYKDGSGDAQELSSYQINSSTLTIRAGFFRGGDNVSSYSATIKSISVVGDSDYPKNIIKTEPWVTRAVISERKATEFGVAVYNGLGQTYCKPATSVQAFYENQLVTDGEVFFEAWPYSAMNGQVLDTGEVVFDSSMKNYSSCSYGVLIDKNVQPRAGNYHMVIKRSDGGADITSDLVELRQSNAIDLPLLDHNTIAARSDAGGFSWQLPANTSLVDHVDFQIEPSDKYGTSKWVRYVVRNIPVSQNSIVLPDDILAQLKAATDYIRVRVLLRSSERGACSASDRVLFKFDGDNRFVQTKAKKGGVAVIPMF